MLAHRFSLILAEGNPVSDEMHAAHSCRNTNCVAPEHLSWKTGVENHADKLRDGTDMRGEKHWKSTVTEKDVISIRKKYDSGLFTTVQLAKNFNITLRTVQKIVARETWRHI